MVSSDQPISPPANALHFDIADLDHDQHPRTASTLVEYTFFAHLFHDGDQNIKKKKNAYSEIQKLNLWP